MPRHRKSRDFDESGLTTVELLVALLVVAGVSLSFAIVLTTTTRFAAKDDLRGRASQLAAKEVESMRAAPWTTAAVQSPASTCIGGELVRSTATPGVLAAPPPVTDPTGTSLQVLNTITWVGTSCTSPQPTYGRLRMTSRVTWTRAGAVEYTEITNYRLPPSDYPVPAGLGASASPLASPTASPSPSAPPSASAAPSSAATPTTAPTPALVTPTFDSFSPAPPKRFCSYQGRTIAPVPMSVYVTGASFGETVTLTWGETGQKATGTIQALTNGRGRVDVTMPTNASAPVGTLEVRLSLAATAQHTASVHSETFEVTLAQNKNRC